MAFSAVSVYATSTYLASQIAYDPSDSNWNVSTVQGALDDLYSNNNCVSGTIEHKANTHWSIDVGFVPKTFVFSFAVANSKIRHFSYNANLSNKIYQVEENGNTLYVNNYTSIFDIGTTITATLPTQWLAYTNEYTIYYTACK